MSNEKRTTENTTAAANIGCIKRIVRRAILFRCLFCGDEYKTVEECNACEAQH